MAEKLYKTYFDYNLRYTPYWSEESVLEEKFLYLKLLLESALSSARLEREGTRTERYLYNQELFGEFEKIREHLWNRSNETCDEYAEEENPDRLTVLSSRLKLSPFFQFLTLLAWGAETELEISSYCRELEQGQKTGLDKRLALHLYKLSGGEVSTGEQAGLSGEVGEFLRVFYRQETDSAIRGLAKGGGRLHIRRSILAFLMGEEKTEFPILKPREEPGKLWLYENEKNRVIRILDKMQSEKEGGVLFLNGRKGCGKSFLLSCVAWEEKRRFLLADISSLSEEEKLEEFYLQSKLNCAIPCLTGFYEASGETTGEGGGIRRERLLRMVSERGGVWIFAGNGGEGAISAHFSRFVSVDFPEPGPSGRAVLWQELLAGYSADGTVNPVLNANKYVLNAGELKRILETASLAAAGSGAEAFGQLEVEDALKVHSRGALGSLAVRVPAVFTWDDLIISEEAGRSLRHICNQVKYRNVVGDQWGFYKKTPYGRGVSALLYGPPGTGKTMAVQVIAGELGMDLYRVDMSQMVSKYIGETEKNITALFDKASLMNAILFFDEADAFFSQRSEVKDANDRNANAEVAHLLQKMEEYQGITLLATNLKDHIDDAFKRRIRFMVDFRFPDGETRKELWKTLLPKEAPVEEELDLDFFAEQFELSGSQIKEVLQNAAFMAAAEGCAIGNSQVKEALKLNYGKYGKILTREEFGYLG